MANINDRLRDLADDGKEFAMGTWCLPRWVIALVALVLVVALAGCAGMPTAESLTPPTPLLQQAATCLANEAEKIAKQTPAQSYTITDQEKMLTAKAIDGMVAISTRFADANQKGAHVCFSAVAMWMEQRGASERQVVAMYQSIANTAGVALQWGVGGWAIGNVVGKVAGGATSYTFQGDASNVNIGTGKSTIGTGGSTVHGIGDQQVQTAGESLVGRDSSVKTSTDTVNDASFNTAPTTP